MTGRQPPNDPDKEIVSFKRVAADGTQRGLKRKGSKNKVTQLIENIQDAIERDTGVKDWDPVVMMAVIAARAHVGYLATDENNNPILDADGNQVVIPPNPELAIVAGAKVAPYVHQQLRPKEVSDEKEEADVNETRDKVLNAFEAMGVEIKEDGT